MKKTYYFSRLIMLGTVALIGGLFLAACAPTPTSTDNLLAGGSNKVLSAQDLASITSGNTISTPSGTIAPTAQPVNTGELPTAPQKEPMKTLADFPKVSAKEATITTNKGDITFSLEIDKAPLTVTNFVTLAKDGFYNGIKFHRIIAGFMAQVGDPLTKDDSKKDLWGTGGPGYTIADEFNPDLKFDGAGVVAMANVGQPNTGGSQIFITYDATPWLNGKHAIFGKVTAGMDVLNKLEIGDQIVKVTYK
jgi:cyclophilin family peptidyl-prolyl cis-trans isomerase